MSVPAAVAARAAELIDIDGTSVAAHFGDPDGEYRAARERVAVMPRPWRSLVRFEGDDRQRFLQGVVSNDVVGLAPGDGCRALFLDVKGHVRADLDLWAEAEAIVAGSEVGFAERTLADLARYILAASVKVDDRGAGEAIIGVIGPGAEALLAGAGLELPPAPRSCAPARLGDTPVRLARTPSLAAPGVELHVPAESLDAVLAALGAAADREPFVGIGGRGSVAGAGDQGSREAIGSRHGPLAYVGWQAAELLRIEAGRPRLGHEITGAEFPQELGLDDAVDYEKGCYLGQETVARIHYRGQVNRLLRGLRLSEPVAPGATLFAGEREVGSVTSAAESPRLGQIALGWVRRQEAEEAVDGKGSDLEARGEDGATATARVTPLPFPD
jgi:folate-binding protein YgfZ